MVRAMTWFAEIVGVDDGGPFVVWSAEESDAETPQGAFENVHGFWDEIDPVNKMHIRIYEEDEYTYSWIPSKPKVLEGVYSGEVIRLEVGG